VQLDARLAIGDNTMTEPKKNNPMRIPANILSA
jgi:hypothetical protein